MAVVMKISYKETQAVNQSGQVDKFKGKRMGPASYKNKLRAQDTPKGAKKPYQGHGGHHVDLAQVRAMDKGNVNTVSVAISKGTIERVRNDPRVQSTNALETVRNYTLTKYGIEKGKRWAVKEVE